MITTDYGADTLDRPPLFQHHLSARSLAALDLLRASGALFGVTPATGGLNFLSLGERGYAIRINSRSRGACVSFWHSGKLELGRGAPGGCERWLKPRDTGMDAARRQQGTRHGRGAACRGFRRRTAS